MTICSQNVLMYILDGKHSIWMVMASFERSRWVVSENMVGWEMVDTLTRLILVMISLMLKTSHDHHHLNLNKSFLNLNYICVAKTYRYQLYYVKRILSISKINQKIYPFQITWQISLWSYYGCYCMTLKSTDIRFGVIIAN